MRNHPLIRMDTIIICADPPIPGEPEADDWSGIVHEVFTFEELLHEYGELPAPSAQDP